MVFERLACCVREWKRCHETIKHDTNIYFKLIENQCNINAPKSDATNIETHRNAGPKREPQTITIAQTNQCGK